MCHKKSKNTTPSLPEIRSRIVPANIYLFKNRQYWKKCEICPKLAIKTPKGSLVPLLLTLSLTFGELTSK